MAVFVGASVVVAGGSAATGTTLGISTGTTGASSPEEPGRKTKRARATPPTSRSPKPPRSATMSPVFPPLDERAACGAAGNACG